MKGPAPNRKPNLVELREPKPYSPHTYYSHRFFNPHALSFLEERHPPVARLARSYSFKTVRDEDLLQKMEALNRPTQPFTTQDQQLLKEATMLTFHELRQSKALTRFIRLLSESYSKPIDYSDEPYEGQAHPGFPECLSFSTRAAAFESTVEKLQTEFPTHPSLTNHIHIVLNKPEFKPTPGKTEYTLARPIMCANLYVHLLCSKTFRPFMEFLLESHLTNPIKLGLSWTKHGAAHIASNCFSSQPGEYASDDFKTWDFSVPAELHTASLQVFLSFLELAAPPNANYFTLLAKRLVDDFIHSKFFLRDHPNLYQKGKGTSTGYYLTALMNSLSHLVLHNFLTLKYSKLIRQPYPVVKAHNQAIIYGDDEITKRIKPYAVPRDWLSDQLSNLGMLQYSFAPPSPQLLDHQFLRNWIVHSPDGQSYPYRDPIELMLKLVYTNDNYQRLTATSTSFYKGFLIAFSLLSPTDRELYILLRDMYLSLDSMIPPEMPSHIRNKHRRFQDPLPSFDHFPTRTEIFKLYNLPPYDNPYTKTNFGPQLAHTQIPPLPFPLTVHPTSDSYVEIDKARSIYETRHTILTTLTKSRRRELRSLLQPVVPFPYYEQAGSKLLDIFASMPYNYKQPAVSWIDYGSHPGHFARALHSLYPSAQGTCISLVSHSPYYAIPNTPLISTVIKDLRNYYPRHHYDVVTYDAYSSDPDLPFTIYRQLPTLQPHLLVMKFDHCFSPTQHHTIALIVQHFESFFLTKPLHSKPWNSEIYLVCHKYLPNTRPYDLPSIQRRISNYAKQCYQWNEFFISNLSRTTPIPRFPNPLKYPLLDPPITTT